LGFPYCGFGGLSSSRLSFRLNSVPSMPDFSDFEESAMPQPLSRLRSDVSSINWSPTAIRDRPTLTAHIMSVIAACSHLEAELGRLLSHFLGAEPGVGMAMYLALSGGEAKRSVLNAAASEALDGNPVDLVTFKLVEKATKPIRKRRNEFAHGIWGTCDELPDALLWHKANDTLLFERRIFETAKKQTVLPLMDLYRSYYASVLVYRLDELEENANQALEAQWAVIYFMDSLSSDRNARTEARKRLLELPMVAKLVENQSYQSGL
jgi:hypothetical protein